MSVQEHVVNQIFPYAVRNVSTALSEGYHNTRFLGKTSAGTISLQLGNHYGTVFQ
jgi:hypothetical protein